ncbi:hypothetical protein RB653_002708 [Dictyostelium firmibasis]|uniref:SKICH domain-containing protein n=1 Tax=Dictyostelium firmibasis TaxID=79012 RepID=A0AAN7YYW9_9MYCE
MSSNHDLDIEEKIASLIGAFSHKREVILEVLKRNNYGIDASALELSEMPVVEQQPQFRQTNNNNNSNVSYNYPSTYSNRQIPQQFHQQPPQQQPPQYQQQQQQQRPQGQQQNQEKERSELIKDIENLIGNNSLDQSTIYAVYQQSNKSIDQTIKTIKELTFDPNEELKKIEAEIEMRKREEEALLEAKRQKKKRDQQLLVAEQQHHTEREQQQRAEREQQQRLCEEYERILKLDHQKKLETERQEQELARRKQLELEQIMILKKQEEAGLRILQEQREHQEKVRLAKEKEEQLKKRCQEEEAKRAAIRAQEITRMSKQQQLEEEAKRLEQQKRQEAEFMIALETKSKEAKLMQQQANFLKQKEQENLQLIEKQKKEIYENQIQIDILKLKELESQNQSKAMLEKAQQEIQELKKKLADGETKFNQETVKKSSDEEELKKQIQELEQQKDLLRRQILDLEGVQKPRLEQLEQELKNKELELQNTIISNQIYLVSSLEENSADTIVVHWNLENKFEEATPYWIGVFPTHQPKNDRYLSFKHVEGKEGLVSFPSIIPGHYEARLFKDKYTLIQKSSSVQVGPSVSLSAHVIGDEISVTYKVNSESGVNIRDWIGIYHPSQRNKHYIESLYASTLGAITFKSPRVPGLYDIRYFLHPTKYNEQAKISFEITDNDKIQVISESQSCLTLSPDQEFKVEYVVNTTPPSSSDWVGIFPVDETNNKHYIHSKYTSSAASGELTFRAPLKTGDYEARFFSYAKGKYIAHKVSNKFSVFSQQ